MIKLWLLMLSLILPVICLPAVVFADRIGFMGESLEYDQIYSYDLEDDGYEELTFFMQENALILSVWDTDADGTPDRWFAYGDDDKLILEGLDTSGNGKPDLFYAIDDKGDATPATARILPRINLRLFLIIGLAIHVLILIIVLPIIFIFHRKNRPGVLSLLLIFIFFSCFVPPALCVAIINEDCEIDEAVFAGEWLKYSDIDAAIDLTTRSWEAQQVQVRSDELRFHYEELYITELLLELERAKRQEIKTIKKLLVNNIKMNLLKSFMRLTYVTYDVVKSGYQLKSSVSMVLDRASSGVQLITSYIKMQKSLSIPSKTKEQTKGLLDRSAKLANSSVLEYFDSAGDPAKIAVNLIKDLQKEALDVVKTADGGTDPKLSDKDFKILRDQYMRNRDFDVALQESYLTSSQLRASRDEHKAAIETLEADYQIWIAREKARIRDLLINSCKEGKTDTRMTSESNNKDDDDNGFISFQYPESLVKHPAFSQLLGNIQAAYNIQITTQDDGSVIYMISQEQRTQIIENLHDSFASVIDINNEAVYSKRASQVINRVYYDEGFKGVTIELDPKDEDQVALAGGVLGASAFLFSILYQSLNEIEYDDIEFSLNLEAPDGGIFYSKTYSVSEMFQ